MSKVLFAGPEVYAIVGSAMAVHRELGAGFLEAVYHEALELQFSMDVIPFESHKRLDVWYRGRPLKKHYEADFVCFGTIVVEIKAQSRLLSGDHAQLLNYLKATRLKVGLLINFGSAPKLEWKRFVF